MTTWPEVIDGKGWNGQEIPDQVGEVVEYEHQQVQVFTDLQESPLRLYWSNRWNEFNLLDLGSTPVTNIDFDAGANIFPNAEWQLASVEADTILVLRHTATSTTFPAAEFNLELQPPDGVAMIVDGEAVDGYLIAWRTTATWWINPDGTEMHLVATTSPFISPTETEPGNAGLVPAPPATPFSKPLALWTDGWQEDSDLIRLTTAGGVTAPRPAVVETTTTVDVTHQMNDAIPGRSVLMRNRGTGTVSLKRAGDPLVRHRILPGWSALAWMGQSGWEFETIGSHVLGWACVKADQIALGEMTYRYPPHGLRVDVVNTGVWRVSRTNDDVYGFWETTSATVRVHLTIAEPPDIIHPAVSAPVVPTKSSWTSGAGPSGLSGSMDIKWVGRNGAAVAPTSNANSRVLIICERY